MPHTPWTFVWYNIYVDFLHVVTFQSFCHAKTESQLVK